MENIFMISLFCLGVHTLTRDNCIFSFWQKVILDKDENLRSELFEPLTECLVCMSSLWSCVFLCYSQGVNSMDGLFFIMAYICLFMFDIAVGEKSPGVAKVLYLCLVGIIVIYLKNPVQSVIMITAVAGLNFAFASIIQIAKNSEDY